MKKRAAITALLAFLPLAAAAQTAAAPAAKPVGPPSTEQIEKEIALLRTDIRNGRTDIVAKSMGIDADQSAVFWPVYKKYQAEQILIGDQLLAVIKDYALNYPNVPEDKAKDLAARSFAIEEQTTALRKKYFQAFLAAGVTAKNAAKFFQIDSRLTHLLDLQLAAQIPLME
jgi:hypothetical protein